MIRRYDQSLRNLSERSTGPSREGASLREGSREVSGRKSSFVEAASNRIFNPRKNEVDRPRWVGSRGDSLRVRAGGPCPYGWQALLLHAPTVLRAWPPLGPARFSRRLFLDNKNQPTSPCEPWSWGMRMDTPVDSCHGIGLGANRRLRTKGWRWATPGACVRFFLAWEPGDDKDTVCTTQAIKVCCGCWALDDWCRSPNMHSRAWNCLAERIRRTDDRGRAAASPVRDLWEERGAAGSAWSIGLTARVTTSTTG